MSSTNGNTMQRAIFTAPHQLEMQEMPMPKPALNQVLVKVHTCALCTFEQRIYSGDEPMYPYAGGHEISGVVVEKGDQVLNVEAGDHVALARLFRCGQCENCRRGYDNICIYAFKRLEGQNTGQPEGLGEYILCKATEVYKVPMTVPLEHAALTEPLSCVLRSIKRANLKPGERVVIVGAGIMGMLHLQLAKMLGMRVIVSEPDEGRRNKALELGADHAFNPLEQDYVKTVKELGGGKGANATFICVAHPSTIEPAVIASADNGRVLLYSSFFPKGKKIEVDPNIFHKREVTLTGTMSQSQEDFNEAAEIVASGRLDLDALISARYPLSDLDNAFKAAEGIGAYRVLVQP